MDKNFGVYVKRLAVRVYICICYYVWISVTLFSQSCCGKRYYFIPLSEARGRGSAVERVCCARSNPSSRDFLAVEEGVGSGSDLVFGGTWRGSRTLVGMHRVRDGHSAGGKELVGVNHLPLTFCPVYENFVNFLETLHFAIELNNCVTTKKSSNGHFC